MPGRSRSLRGRRAESTRSATTMSSSHSDRSRGPSRFPVWPRKGSASSGSRRRSACATASSTCSTLRSRPTIRRSAGAPARPAAARLQAQVHRLAREPWPAQGSRPGIRDQGARLARLVHAPHLSRRPRSDAQSEGAHRAGLDAGALLPPRYSRARFASHAPSGLQCGGATPAAATTTDAAFTTATRGRSVAAQRGARCPEICGECVARDT
jgi:hypothetical protein